MSPGLSPRAHLALSYGVAALVFPAVLAWRLQPDAFAGADDAPVHQALLPAILWIVHFVRRTAESGFMQRFSRGRIRLSDAATVYLYYWGFAFWISYSCSTDDFTLPPALLQGAAMSLFVIGQAGNYSSHRILSNLRAQGSRDRKIPRGLLFDYVSCPHYFFEIITWWGYFLLTGLPAPALFALLGTVILTRWARKRHLAYRREFDGKEGRELYPHHRRIIFPFVY